MKSPTGTSRDRELSCMHARKRVGPITFIGQVRFRSAQGHLDIVPGTACCGHHGCGHGVRGCPFLYATGLARETLCLPGDRHSCRRRDAQWLNTRWYIVHAYSNFEKKVASTIREQADMQGLGDLIAEIEVPTGEVVEVVRGRKRTPSRSVTCPATCW